MSDGTPDVKLDPVGTVGCTIMVVVALVLMFGGGFIKSIQPPATCPPAIVVTATESAK